MPQTSGKGGLAEQALAMAATRADIRSLLRSGVTAALATSDSASAHPYVSLVQVATAPNAAPLLLLSRLARHTRNLRADDRASLLFDGTRWSADPLAGGRVTLIGRIVGIDRDETVLRARFLSRHPTAASYVDFQDFAFYTMAVQHAHFIGGFGRIVELPAPDVLIDINGADGLIAAETEILVRIGAEHAELAGLCASRLLGQPEADWRIAGIDPEGADLLGIDRSGMTRCARLVFKDLALTPEAVLRTLADLAAAVRGASPRPQEGLT